MALVLVDRIEATMCDFAEAVGECEQVVQLRACKQQYQPVAFQAGASLLIDQAECAVAADRLGVALYGFSPADVDAK